MATKTGTSDFYRGYTDGFNGAEFNAPDFDWKARRDYDEGFDKGQGAELEQYRYVGVVSTKKVVEPKKGSSPFYRGYTDGFEQNLYNPNFRSLSDQRDYEQGYDKGQNTADCDEVEQYRFETVVPKAVTVTLTPGSAWPFPTR